MAKDPAFLFYPGDWLGGTMGMTLEQKGAYMELLIFQFNNGPFTEAQAKQVLSICYTSVWQVLSTKFVKTGDLYENQRLSNEIEKRKKFSESRRANAKGHTENKSTSKAYAKHMENENRNVIEDKNRIVSVGDPSASTFVVVRAKYASDYIYKIFGPEGLAKYLETNESKLTHPALAPKFMATNDGQHFEDLRHLKNTYKLFVQNHFK